MPVTLRFQSSGAVPGDSTPIVMQGPSLTIGRGPDNDVVLPDPERLISKHHCAIEDHDGDVTVIDFSTNGTYLNYGKTPLGRVPTPLNDGDVLSLGAYELVVVIMPASGTRDPLSNLPAPAEDERVSHGDAETTPESLLDLLNDPAAKRADFLDDLMGESMPRGPSQVIREDPIDSLMMPEIGEAEDPILGKIPDPLEDEGGPTIGDDASPLHDGFTAPRKAAPVIPDDWDDDFMQPAAPPAPPPAATPEPPPPAAVPPETRAPEPVSEAKPAPAAKQTEPEPAAPEAKPGSEHDERSPFAEPVAPNKVTSSVVPPHPAMPRSTPPAPEAKPARPAPPRPQPGQTDNVDAARAFFRGAGAEDINIPEEELAEAMERIGEIVFTLISGLREILMTRSSIKSEFRINQTMIAAGGNNPLKFSLSPEHAVEFALKPQTKGYLDGKTAVAQALNDIKAHEVAMVTGMQAAIKDVLVRLDPKSLEERIGSGNGLSDLLKGRKSRYWETYAKLYAEISEQAEHEFHEFFSKEFAKAYQKQLEKLK